MLRLMCLMVIAALSAGHPSLALTAQEPKPETKSSTMPVPLPELGARLTAEQVSAFAKLALANIHTEYPNKPGNVVWDEGVGADATRNASSFLWMF